MIILIIFSPFLWCCPATLLGVTAVVEWQVYYNRTVFRPEEMALSGRALITSTLRISYSAYRIVHANRTFKTTSTSLYSLEPQFGEHFDNYRRWLERQPMVPQNLLIVSEFANYHDCADRWWSNVFCSRMKFWIKLLRHQIEWGCTWTISIIIDNNTCVAWPFKLLTICKARVWNIDKQSQYSSIPYFRITFSR